MEKGWSAGLYAHICSQGHVCSGSMWKGRRGQERPAAEAHLESGDFGIEASEACSRQPSPLPAFAGWVSSPLPPPLCSLVTGTGRAAHADLQFGRRSTHHVDSVRAESLDLGNGGGCIRRLSATDLVKWCHASCMHTCGRECPKRFVLCTCARRGLWQPCPNRGWMFPRGEPTIDGRLAVFKLGIVHGQSLTLSARRPAMA